PGASHNRDLAEVDTAADHDQAHAKAENAQDRNAAQQIEQVAQGRETVERQAEADQERDRNQQNDLLLTGLAEDEADARRTCRGGRGINHDESPRHTMAYPNRRMRRWPGASDPPEIFCLHSTFHGIGPNVKCQINFRMKSCWSDARNRPTARLCAEIAF